MRRCGTQDGDGGVFQEQHNFSAGVWVWVGRRRASANSAPER
jgi:hypothetical protein